MKTENEVIARLLASTHKQKRPFSIIDVADDIDWLSKHLGSLTAVAVLINVSTGMLSQFLRVRKLTPEAQALVKSREIDSVTAVHNLAKFSGEDQRKIAQQIKQGSLRYLDIRLLNPLRTQFPDFPIETLIHKLKDSENKKVSVILFDPEVLHKDMENIRQDLSDR